MAKAQRRPRAKAGTTATATHARQPRLCMCSTCMCYSVGVAAVAAGNLACVADHNDVQLPRWPDLYRLRDTGAATTRRRRKRPRVPRPSVVHRCAVPLHVRAPFRLLGVCVCLRDLRAVPCCNATRRAGQLGALKTFSSAVEFLQKQICFPTVITKTARRP